MVELSFTCDRCGKKFMPSEKNVKYILYGPDEKNPINPSMKRVDLCEDCNEALRDFMEG